MRLFFIRHGQSANNALWDETGTNKGRSVDPELTEIGRQQAERLGAFIAQKDAESSANGTNGETRRDYFRFTHLYTSLMVRSVATATYIAHATGLPLYAWPEIHECGGIYREEDDEVLTGLAGNPRSYFQEHYSHLILPETITEAGWWNRPFEAREDRPLRAQRVVETLLERHGGTDDRVAIVSHGGFYMELVRILFRIGEPNSWFLMYNTAVSRFDFRENGEVRLNYHNRTDHLPEHLIT